MKYISRCQALEEVNRSSYNAWARVCFNVCKYIYFLFSLFIFLSSLLFRFVLCPFVSRVLCLPFLFPLFTFLKKHHFFTRECLLHNRYLRCLMYSTVISDNMSKLDTFVFNVTIDMGSEREILHYV